MRERRSFRRVPGHARRTTSKFPEQKNAIFFSRKILRKLEKIVVFIGGQWQPLAGQCAGPHTDESRRDVPPCRETLLDSLSEVTDPHVESANESLRDSTDQCQDLPSETRPADRDDTELVGPIVCVYSKGSGFRHF